MNTLDINTCKESKAFRSYLLPSMISMLAVSCYSFADTFVIGHSLGAVGVGAMGLTTPALSMLYAFGFLFGAGGAVRYGSFKGMNLTDKGKVSFSTAVIAAILTGICIGVFGSFFMQDLVRFLGATEETESYVIQYLRFIITPAVFFILDIVLSSFMRNEGHPAVAMTATITGTGLNVILDFIFVLVFGWGMTGAASATFIASFISVCINITYSIVNHIDFGFSIKKFSFRELLVINKIGLGSAVLEVAVALITLVFLHYAAYFYGDEGVAAFTVIITVNLICYSLINGVAQGVQPLISSNHGAGNKKRIDVFVRYGIITSLSLGVIFFIVCQIIPENICSLFVTDSAEVLSLSSFGLRFHAFAFIFMAVSILYGIYFQSKEKSVSSLSILLGRSVIFPIVMILILSHAGSISLWISIPLGELVSCILSIVLRAIDK